MLNIDKRKSFLPGEEMTFFWKVILVYGCWKLIHAYLWRSTESMDAWHLQLAGYESLYASLTCTILRWIGYPSYATGNVITVDSTHGTYIAEHCLAIPAMFIFSFSLLLFRGKISEKAWFIPLGILSIFLLNLFRLVSLCVLMTHMSEFVYQVYHRYVFLVITYGAILLMVVLWMDRVMSEPAASAARGQ